MKPRRNASDISKKILEPRDTPRVKRSIVVIVAHTTVPRIAAQEEPNIVKFQLFSQ